MDHSKSLLWHQHLPIDLHRGLLLALPSDRSPELYLLTGLPLLFSRTDWGMMLRVIFFSIPNCSNTQHRHCSLVSPSRELITSSPAGHLCILMSVLWHFQYCIILYWLMCLSHLQWPLHTSARTLLYISLFLHCHAQCPAHNGQLQMWFFLCVKLNNEMEGREIGIPK